MKLQNSVVLTLENAPTKFIDAGGTHFAYRTIGTKKGVPLVLLQHFTGTIDYWDPAVVNGLSKEREVIVFDNAGVGASSGKVPDNIEQMSTDALAFIKALGFKKVDLLGYSLGGMIAQYLAAQNPELVRKVILANTVHQGGGNDLMKVLNDAMSQKTYSDPRMVLFFTESKNSIEAGQAFLKRTSARKKNRDPEVGPDVANAQAKALIVFSTTQDSSNKLLNAITQPVLIVTGSNDTMLPTKSSYEMFQILKNAQLMMYPDSNHGAIFQYHDQFVNEVNNFLKH
ncbi:MAG: alpha/beta hydrolase [Pseudomonadota bacterium]